MTFKVDERIFETSITTGTGEYTLLGAQTGYQPVSVLGANNSGPFVITDGTNWEVIIGKYVSGPARLQRTHIMASSTGGSAINWGAGTRQIRCAFPAWAFGQRVVTKDVSGNSNIALTLAEQLCDVLILNGTLTGNINVTVDETLRKYEVINSAAGAFTLTFKTTSGTGYVIPAGHRQKLRCDGTNIIATMNSIPGGLAVGTSSGVLQIPDGTVSAPGLRVGTSSTTGLFSNSDNSIGVTTNGVQAARFVSGALMVGPASAPSTKLHVKQSSNGTTGALRLERSDTSAATNLYTGSDDTFHIERGGSTYSFGSAGLTFNGTVIPFHKEYQSAQQTITAAGALTLAHGLGAAPKIVQLILKCATAEANYSVGDEVVMPAVVGEGTHYGAAVRYDATNVVIRYGSAANTFFVVDASTGNHVAITNANWRLIVKAFA